MFFIMLCSSAPIFYILGSMCKFPYSILIAYYGILQYSYCILLNITGILRCNSNDVMSRIYT